MSKPLVFVTGASGFIALHIVNQLLDKGYRVRGSARGLKTERLREVFRDQGDFEAVEVPDIASTDLTAAFDGVDFLIHAAAPLVGRVDAEGALNFAVKGTIHVLKAAEKAGIKKVIVTGSMVSYPAVFDPPYTGPFAPSDWHPITPEQARSGNPLEVYIAEKKLTEQATIKFAEEHPDIDISVVDPPYTFGPLAHGFEHIHEKINQASISADMFVYALLDPDNKSFIRAPAYCDVREIARAHIAAFEADTAALIPREKRFLIVSPHAFDYKKAIELIATERPALKARLVDPKEAPVWDNYRVDMDYERVERLIGFKVDSYRTWQETVLDAIDSFVAIEKIKAN
ncbi:NAD(P)-binding protein [Fistulina hepatica ATCC 64428]|uniref:NAD(P)-binding protein n=1 Tax=Fistulina hepatica ATCC 64428 TaxID=1128425 RepID=A0A0D7ACB5_9AGAR|nr:NAD(P)-binding protein [Fistulina hepatica ATCC 64428]